MYLIFDTETTGFRRKELAPDHPEQGRICQLACLLLDKDFKEIESFKTLIKPDGWVISPGAEAVHKISLERCEAEGIPIAEAISTFYRMSLLANYKIAHNISFDSGMLDLEMSLVGYKCVDWKDKSNICTMHSTTNICKLPGKNGKQYKWPKLQEVYSYLFKKTFDYAHDAMADVRATAEVFKWLVENKKIAL